MLTDVSAVLEETLDQLQRIWDRIGIVADQRTARTNVVVNHMKNLLGEMVKEEENLMHRLIENVEKYSSELRKLTHELQLPPHEVSIVSSSVYYIIYLPFHSKQEMRCTC